MLLTRAPLYSGSCLPFLARLACVRHAASVRSEPGSNSPVETGAPHRPRAARRDTSSDASDLASTKNRAVRSITLGTFSAKLMGKGALLFSFQRPAASAGRPRRIRSATQLVKQRCPCLGSLEQVCAFRVELPYLRQAPSPGRDQEMAPPRPPPGGSPWKPDRGRRGPELVLGLHVHDVARQAVACPAGAHPVTRSRTRAIAMARPVSSSTSTWTPWTRTGPVATSNRTGIWLRKRYSA